MARNSSPTPPSGRLAQMRVAFDMTRKQDPKLVPLMVGPALGLLVVLIVIGVVLGHPAYFTVIGVLAAIATATLIFGRRASKAMYAQVEGQPGAAAAVVQGMRGDWRVTPAVAFNRNQDLVHRAVGRPGVVLLGEGSPSRTATLLAQEKKRVARVVAEVPIYEVLIGDGEGQVPIRKLQQHLTKLPRNLKRGQVDLVEGRMRALGGTNVPIPKGPMPKGGRMPRGGQMPRGKIR